ncbi:MAG: yfiH [Gammaproteobacteria bacterium]|jgi:YfiH family protein|nr:yfiH [Gammaproteobacteria bacterium]
MTPTFIQPNWPAPPHIKAYTTLRTSGVSPRDEKTKIDADRLVQLLQLPGYPLPINQTHSDIAIPALPEYQGKEADAIFSNQPNQVCLVCTADCLPVLLTHRQGTSVAAIHAGWRGLAKGIITKTVRALNISSSDILAWLGPAITQPCYETSEEVRQQFIEKDPATESAFIPSGKNGHWLLDLYAIARIELSKMGITAIYRGDYCTYSNPTDFFSFRRDGKILGNMATLIWISDNSASIRQ